MAKLENEGSNGRSVLWMMLAGLGILMTTGAIARFLEHIADGGGVFSVSATIILMVFVAIIGGLGFSSWRNARQLKANANPLTRREKVNNRMLVGSGILGGLIAAALIASGEIGAEAPNVFSSGPIAPAVAITIAFLFGVIAPLSSWYWHTRAIDEQEASAYRDGGYYAAYAYLILAPVWWLLWRGGLVPDPGGVAIYLSLSVIWSAVWLWKKYH